jgi:hypothetical protein
MQFSQIQGNSRRFNRKNPVKHGENQGIQQKRYPHPLRHNIRREKSAEGGWWRELSKKRDFYLKKYSFLYKKKRHQPSFDDLEFD